MSGACLPILQTHALHARTDPHVDHAGLNGIRDINARLQSTRTLPIQRLHGRTIREPSRQRRSPELSGPSTGRQHRPDGDILDERGVDARAGDEGLEGADEEVSGRCVLEAALPALGDGRAEGTCYDDVVGGFGEDCGVGLEVRGHLGETLLDCGCHMSVWGVMLNGLEVPEYCVP
jgi:hypothetical protein